MKSSHLIIIATGLLAGIACTEPTNKNENIDTTNIENMGADTLKNEESDYQNQAGSRTNSDTLMQPEDSPYDPK